ncbi:restriction endonuclease [Pseudomonas sp. PDM16]|uniref:restriction endonuclease n=1 Tax=Pseudomonas sp. PDM16 TaxID=2769292 RepID=UPI001785E42A|nr:restriction endonuclease [Pseudomonas sp. PDM16]MBD9415263.1 restriction endonuclease [Pseudomonas sp. PDM16]
MDSLLQVSPAHFEVIALDVLHRLGYGARREDLQQVGGSGDGLISLDALGLEKVYVQNTVGHPELQAFCRSEGQARRIHHHLWLSAQAVDFARSVEGMVLVDGRRPVNLMMDHEVDVT